MKFRILEALDTTAHKLRLPFRRWLCDRYDLALGLTPAETKRDREAVEFYRRPENQVPAGPAVRRKQRPRITGWYCPHLHATSAPGVLTRADCGQGCEMQPVYAYGTAA